MCERGHYCMQLYVMFVNSIEFFNCHKVNIKCYSVVKTTLATFCNTTAINTN